MFKKVYFYFFLVLFFASSQAYGMEQKPAAVTTTSTSTLPQKTSESCTTSTNQEYSTVCKETEYVEPEVSLETILQEISSIAGKQTGQEELKGLLNLLYLKKELLNVFIAEKTAAEIGSDDQNFDEISNYIISEIAQLENILTHESLQMLENVEDLLMENRSKLCFSNLLMFFDFRKKYCTKYIEAWGKVPNLILNIQMHQRSFSCDRLGGLSKFFKEIDYAYPESKFAPDVKYLDTSILKPRMAMLLKKYFDFFDKFQLNSLGGNVSEELMQSVTAVKTGLKQLSELFQLSIQFDDIFNKKKLISLFGNAPLFENTYNTVYEEIYKLIETKETTLIAVGPDKGKMIPDTLFEKKHEEKTLQMKISQIGMFINYSILASDMLKQATRHKQSQVEESHIIRQFLPLANFMDSTQTRSLIEGFLQMLTFDLQSQKNHSIKIPGNCLSQYLLYLKEKYEIELISLEKQNKKEHKSKRKQQQQEQKEKQQKLKKLKKLKEKQQQTKNSGSQITLDTSIVMDLGEKAPAKSDAPQAIHIHTPTTEEPYAEIEEEKTELHTSSMAMEANEEPGTDFILVNRPKKQKFSSSSTESVASITQNESSNNISSMAAKIENALYGDEQIIKETPLYKILVKSWGSLPSQGYTLILYNGQANGIDLAKYSYLQQAKFDKFHFIPEHLELKFGIFIEPDTDVEKQFNTMVNPVQHIYLEAKMFAVCVKAAMLPKFAFRWFTNKPDAQIMDLLTWPTGIGFHKGAFTFIFDTNTNECFHQCFHEFSEAGALPF